MKKYFLMLATLAATALMVSCGGGDGGDGPGPGPGPTGEVKLSEAIYYGEKVASKTGLYSVTLTNGTEKIRLDLFAAVSENPDAAKLAGGTYTKGTKEEPVLKTYFVATETTDEMGTLMWNGTTPVLVTGGDITVASSASGYRIALSLVAGGKSIDWVYNGKITFENKFVEAPREPIVASSKDYAFQYVGEYVKAAEQLGTISLIMLDSNDDRRLIQLNLTVPFPADADKVAMPVGTFDVVSNPNAANKVIAGAIEGGFVLNSLEYTINAAGKTTGGIIITGGTLTVSKAGDAYSIAADLSGTKFNTSGQLLGNVDDIIWTVTIPEFPEFADDKTRPMSSLEASVDTGTALTEAFVDQWEMKDGSTSLLLNRVILYEETVGINPNNKDYPTDGTVYVGGEGMAVGLQYVTTKSETFPVGTFNIGKVFDPFLPKPSVGSAGAANIYSYDLLGLGNGCWYIEIGDVDGSVMSTGGAGSMPNQGFVKITELETTLQIEFEFFDKNGHKVTGSYNGVPKTPSAASASFSAVPVRIMNTFQYVPSVSMLASNIGLMRSGMVMTK